MCLRLCSHRSRFSSALCCSRTLVALALMALSAAVPLQAQSFDIALVSQAPPGDTPPGNSAGVALGTANSTPTNQSVSPRSAQTPAKCCWGYSHPCHQFLGSRTI